MRALSLWQPWASFVDAGLKTVETRSWGTDYRGEVAIHAAHRRPRLEEGEAILRAAGPNLGLRVLDVMDRPPALGAVVAVARISACFRVLSAADCGHRLWVAAAATPGGASVSPVEAVLGDLSPGRFAWLLADIRPLREPHPLRGRQGLWTLSAEEDRAIRALASPRGGT